MTAVLDRPADTVVRYEPRGAARELWSNRDDTVLMCGPAGTGKSLVALWKLHMACLNMPKLRGLIVRQTHVSLTSTTLVTFEEEVIAEALATGIIRWFGGSARKPPAYIYSNKATIVIGGLDKPVKWMGGQYDRVVIDEATETSAAALEALITRMRAKARTFKQIILCCNPDSPTHWINQRATDGGLPMLTSRHQDNPRYYAAITDPDGTVRYELTAEGHDYIEGKLGQLTGVRRLRLLLGIWAAAEGVIFEEWDPDTHLIPMPEFDEDTPLCSAGMPWDWPRYWTVDFGFTNPFVLQRWAVDPDGRAYRYAEIYRTKRLVEDHAADVMDQVAPRDDSGQRGWTEPEPQAVICDHDAEGRATFTEKTELPTIAALKAVSDGIQAVQSRLKHAGDDKPRLFLIQGARTHVDLELKSRALPTCTEEEMPGYVWADHKTKEEPVKKDDHGADALRYLAMHLDRGQTEWMRWVA
jgi:Terminase large subunit, T4likevirus-type, N-terminal